MTSSKTINAVPEHDLKVAKEVTTLLKEQKVIDNVRVWSGIKKLVEEHPLWLSSEKHLLEKEEKQKNDFINSLSEADYLAYEEHKKEELNEVNNGKEAYTEGEI